MAVIPLVPRSASQIIGVVPVDTRDGYGFSLGIGAYRVKALSSAATWWYSTTDGLPTSGMTQVDPGVEVSFTGPQAALYCKGEQPITLQVTFDPPLSAALPGDVTLTGVQTLTNKRITPRVVALTDAATVTPNADTSDIASIAALSQSTTIANPTGTPTDGQRLEVRLTTAASQALAYGNKFRSTVSYTLPSASLGGGATERLVFEWIAAASKWDLVGYDSMAAAGGGGGLFGSRTLVVSEGGDDAAGAADPYAAEFLTIEAAMIAAAVGDLVVVRPGAYSPNMGGGRVAKTGVNCLCFPGVTIHLLSGSWAGDGGGAGEIVHDLIGYPTMSLDAGTLILKRTGSGTAKGRYEIREITGVGQGFCVSGGAMNLDIDLAFDAAVNFDFATDPADPVSGQGIGFLSENSSADSEITLKFRKITLTEAAGSEASSRVFWIGRATTKFYAKGRRTAGALELRGLTTIDVDFLDPGTSVNLVLSTVRLAGGTCWLSCIEVSGLLGNRAPLNVSHNGAILHMLRGRVRGIDGDQDTGHALIYTDGGVGINLYAGVVLIAGNTGATLCLAPNAGVGSIAINARIFGTILANKAKSGDVTLTVGAITVDSDVT